MERDDESGLAYHSARYYAPWLGRWTAADPVSLLYRMRKLLSDPSPHIASLTVEYCYGFDSPSAFVDPLGGENIVVVGSQHDNSQGNKMMFVHQGLAQLWRYRDEEAMEGRSLVLFKEGYTPAQIWEIQKAAVAAGARFVIVDSVDEFIRYVNTKSTIPMCPRSPRSKDKVSDMDIFAHGVVGAIEFGYGLRSSKVEEYRLDAAAVARFEATAFGPDRYQGEDAIRSYACRTGLGNPGYDKLGGLFPRASDSLARAMAEAADWPVQAYLVRTHYGHTLGTALDRLVLDRTDPAVRRLLPLARSEARRKVVDGADFDPRGAMHPVFGAMTPFFVHSGPVVFWPSSWGRDSRRPAGR